MNLSRRTVAPRPRAVKVAAQGVPPTHGGAALGRATPLSRYEPEIRPAGSHHWNVTLSASVKCEMPATKSRCQAWKFQVLPAVMLTEIG